MPNNSDINLRPAWGVGTAFLSDHSHDLFGNFQATSRNPPQNSGSTNPTILELLAVRDISQYRKVSTSGRIFSDCCMGIELELEHASDIEINSKYWNVIEDGSLRNRGREFVSKIPLSGDNLEQALEHLREALSPSGWRVTERCSTHIHTDVTDLNYKQFKNFMACAVLFEHVLVNLFGKGRLSNNFCLPVDCNSKMYNYLVEVFTTHHNIVRSHIPKYCAISLKRLIDLGTVEFRMFHCMTNIDEIFQVANFIQKMKHFSLGLENPQDLIDLKKSQDLEQIFMECFGYNYYTPDMEGDIERGIQTLNDLILTSEVESIVSSRTQEISESLSRLQEERARLSEGLTFRE